MSHEYSISYLLDIKDIQVLSLKEEEQTLQIHFRLQRKPHRCPQCNQFTDKVHDYRLQRVKDLPFRGKPLIWLYEKRRYACPHCHKRFAEPTPHLPRYHRHTNRLVLAILSELGFLESLKILAIRYGVSVSTLHRWQQLLDYGPPNTLPEVISIDEFRGNANHEKFQCALTDPVNRRLLDVLPSRKSEALRSYFLQFSLAQRKRVRYISIDMSSLFYNTLKPLFPNAIFIADRFHVVRQVIWAFDMVRKEIQRSLSKYRRRYFKRSRKLLIRRRSELNETDLDAVDNMLNVSNKLATAYYLKELFYEVMDSPNRSQAVQHLLHFKLTAHVSALPAFQSILTMLANWEDCILNSFDFRITNAFTEGMNNKIKVIKRVAFGYRNFENFRRRILAASR